MSIRCLGPIVPEYAFLRIQLRSPRPKILYVRQVPSIIASQFPAVAELNVGTSLACSGVAVVLVPGGVVVFVSGGGSKGSATQEGVY